MGNKDRMRAIVIGGTGFLGSHLIDHLLEKDYDILCIGRSGSDTTYMDNLGIARVAGDILDQASIEKHLQEGDIVFHLSALLGVAKVSRMEYFKVNVDGAVNVLKAAISKNARAFVFMSSFGAMGPVGNPEKPMDEATPCRPDSYYGESKLVAEDKIREISAGKITSIVVRPPSIFGQRFAPRSSASLLFKTMQKKTAIIIGDTMNYLPICFVRNLVAAMVTFAELKEGGHHTYLIAETPPVRLNEQLKMIGQEFGVNRRILHIPFWLAYSIAWFLDMLGKLFRFTPLLSRDVVLGMAKSVYYYDIEKALKDGYQPVATLAEGVRETTEWMKSELQ